MGRLGKAMKCHCDRNSLLKIILLHFIHEQYRQKENAGAFYDRTNHMNLKLTTNFN